MSATRLPVFHQPAPGVTAAVKLDAQGRPAPTRETDDRIARILDGLRRVPSVEVRSPAADPDRVARLLPAVHARDYLDHLRRQSETLAQGNLLIEQPFVAPGVRAETAIVQGVYDAAFQAAETALSAARAVAEGAPAAYALCRPPGHHAGPAWLGGYCYLNNAALALRSLRDAGLGPVGVIDIDYHFGNGTAAILRAMGDGFFASVHCSTELAFPYLPEVAAEGPSELFLPFRTPPNEERFLAAVAHAVEAALHRGCRSLVVSVGFDTIHGDPHAKWTLPPTVLRDVGCILRQSGLPLCLVQEGGYGLDILADCAEALASGLLNGTTPGLDTQESP